MRKLTPMYYFKQIVKSKNIPDVVVNALKLQAYYVDTYVRQVGHWA